MKHPQGELTGQTYLLRQSAKVKGLAVVRALPSAAMQRSHV
ncbi:hypothetical protein M7I_3946 [Glarea lozoyensis 74030]|uniref:Uncharacterized protein n=1 Tax=Glarea lozoyensis (strain ATCC 74030 / MF5533) TaxID=1104152 RepID=H0EMU8_GLAL7|nr:hypothetical protein M7I_3946 [Glarea lozoyensis 74030]